MALLDRVALLRVPRACRALLFLAAMLCAGTVRADVSPPPIEVCDAAPTADLPGSTPTQPGTWWNPNRFGTSWALMYQDNDTELTVNWYTYDASGRPIWLIAGPATITPQKTWSAPLRRQSWNWVTNKPGQATTVGSVAIRFIAGDPTRVALRWQWNGVDNVARDECIQDFARPGPSDGLELLGDNLVTTDHVNTAFNGYWFEPTLEGYGLSLQMQQNTDVDPLTYSEAWGLTIFDDAGNPVWLLAKAPDEPNPPELDAGRVLTLEYHRAGPGYPQDVPINDCTGSDNCIVTHADVGTLLRSFSSAATGTASLSLYADHLGTNALPISFPKVTLFQRPADAGVVGIQKVTAVTQILVDRTQCQVPPGEASCSVTVNWAVDPNAGAIGVYRINLDAPALPPALSTLKYGESEQSLVAGERVQFQIRAGGQVLHQTPEIRAIGDPIADVPDAAPTSAATLNAALGTHNPAIGAMAGQASTDGGAAGYAIPIVAPPGRRRMAPDLSLVYDSRAGNGIAGMGWSLEGQSSIHRCPQTVAQDGRSRAVTFEWAHDKLCLDGQRLVAVSGQYGNKNTVYATEVDSFVRVIQHGGTLNHGAVFFEVRHKNGEVAWYGGVDLDACDIDCGAEVLAGTSRPKVSPTEPDGTEQASALSWPIERRVDTKGNLVRYLYTSFTPGELLLTDIYYTGQQSTAPKQSTDGNRRIQLSYAVRPFGPGINDAATTYIGGKVLRTPRRLALVTTYVGSEKVREYTPTYAMSAGTGRSLLIALQECAYRTAVAKDCKPATTFEWDQGAASYQLRADARINAIADPSFSEMEGDFSTSVRFEAVGDFNGDGSRELLWKGPASGEKPVPQQRLVSLRSDRSVAWSLVIPAEQVGTFGGVHTDFSGRADFDLDGRADLITLPKPAPNSTTRKVMLQYWHGAPAAASFNTAFSKTLDTAIPVDDLRSIAFTGDMNGDGRPDIVTERQNPNGGPACAVQVITYLNLPGALPNSPISFAAQPALCLTGTPNPNGGYYTESIAKIADISGDGLPDIWVNDKANSTQGFVRVLVPLWTRTNATTWSSSWSVMAADGYFLGGRDSQEKNKALFSLWLDANGDGLEDWAYTRATGSNGMWALRLNIGKGFGKPVSLGADSPLHRLGIEDCNTIGGGTGCNSLWQPWRAGLIRVMDTDGDGRDEILVPRKFAARVCSLHEPEPLQGQICQNALTDNLLGDGAEQPSVSPDDSCHHFYYCPEDPSGASVTPALLTLKFDGNHDGIPESATAPSESRATYFRGASEWDRSSYLMAAIEFAEKGNNAMALSRTDTDIVVNANSGWSSDDIYGDGLVDAPLKVACFNDIARRCATPWKDANNVALPAEHYPSSLPNNLPLFTRQALLNENLGPGGQLGSDGKTPATPDMMVGVVDGLGVATTWEYYPLSSKAGRTAAQTPLYKPASTAGPVYVDQQHIYFTSTMPVVSTMTSSNGVGGTRLWRYGYEEAMYNQQGRGFQGFRAVIEEDVTASVRVRTTFDQVFPLTGKPVTRTTSFILGEQAGLVETVSYYWRCDRADRKNEQACKTFTPGAGKFPYLDTTVTMQYDPTVAAAGGVPVELTRRVEVNAKGTLSATCSVAHADNVSGYDAYGNLTGVVAGLYDNAPMSQLLNRRCETTHLTYAVNADPNEWWINKPTSKWTQSRAAYGVTHSVPSGAGNPARDLHTAYLWNTDRTLQSETVGDVAAPSGTTAAPMTRTTYSYDTYGQPTQESTQANNRNINGTFSLQELRRTVTSYSSGGYFPQTVSRFVNANTAHTTTLSITRARDGQPELAIDPNGLKTKMQYDAFGALTATESRNAADTANRAPIRRRAVAACVGCIPFARYKVTEVQDGTPRTIAYHDQLGRVLRQETALLDGGVSRVETEYDELGRVIAQSAPYRDGEIAQYTYFTEFDLAGRVGRTYVPRNLIDKDGNNFGDLEIDITYSGRRVETTECGTQSSNGNAAPCRSTSQVSDMLGHVLVSTDAAGQTSRYWFDGAGNTIAVQGVDATTTKATYNAFGHRTQVDDPNQGVWNFTYNGLGELRYQTDARNIATTFDYDWHGRLTRRTASAHAAPLNAADVKLDSIVDTYAWDPTNARGLPAGSARTVNGATERAQLLTYDNDSRPTEVFTTQATITQGPTDYRHRTVYDANFGRIKAEAWPNNAARRFVYAATGQVKEERDPVANTLYRRINAVDGRGQVTNETLGALTATRTYAPSTGQMLSFAYKTGTTKRRVQDYRYDLFGNLSQRTLDSGVAGITAPIESYANDALDRLTSTQRSGGASGTVTYTYTANGNLRTKSDYSLGNGYTYGAVGKAAGGNAGPHAVRQVQRSAEGGNGTVSFAYDNNGNLTTITDPATPFAALYDHRNLPSYVQRGAATSRLFYGADDQRARQTGSDGEHVYLPAFEHVLAAGGTAPIETRAYLGYAVIARNNGATTFEYLLTDRLGSIDAVASPTGTITEKRAYDAFGAPRNGTTWSNLTPKRLQTLATTQQGYTGHEHLNSVELIHMNGRAYDYKVGRFLSVDPLIQFPLNSQSLNPYSYVLNNPLSWTDPSGNSPVCDADKGSCKAPADGETTKIKRSVSGSRVRETIGTMTGTTTQVVGAGGAGAAGAVSTHIAMTYLSNGSSNQGALGESRTGGGEKGASGLGAAESRAAVNSASGDQARQGADFRKRASTIESRIYDQIKRDPYKDIELPVEDLAVLMEADRHDLERSQRQGGNLSDMSLPRFLMAVHNIGGDGRFIAWAESTFNVTGLPAPYAGRSLGTDINYYFQGFVWRAGGYSSHQMKTAITAWNTAQVPTEGIRNLRQIRHADKWAQLGYEHFRKASDE